MRPSKLWKTIMDECRRPIISPDAIYWDHEIHNLGIGMSRLHFVAPNRAILPNIDNNTYVLYFKNRRLHGYALGEK